MAQRWEKYIEEYEDLEEREYKQSFKHKKKKLDHSQAKKIKETKKNGTQYPKKPRR